MKEVKKCEYCNCADEGFSDKVICETHYDEAPNPTIRRKGDRYYLSILIDIPYVVEERVDEKINYCPMCGRKLSND